MKIASASVMVMWLAGCAVGPAYQPPATPAVADYTPDPLPGRTEESSGEAWTSQTFLLNSEAPPDWWRLFGVTALNNLVERGLASNLTIKAAEASLASAHELALGARGGLLPAVDGSVGAARSRANEASIGSASISDLFNTFNAGVSATYTFDVLGRQRHVIEAFNAEETVAAEILRGARLAVVADIVTTSVTLASIEAQIDSTESLVKTESETLVLAQKRLNLGHASLLEVLSQQSELDRTSATLPPLRQQWRAVRNTLAVLVGEAPSQFEAPQWRLKDFRLPAELPVELPVRVLSQRPDVRASAALVRAAAERVGVATADLLPQLSVSAALGGTANHISDTLGGGFGAWSLGAGLVQPIFRGGELRHQRRSTIKLYDAAVAEYHATVLTALENVANVLTAIDEDAKLTRLAEEGMDAANRALTLAQQSFAVGGTSYLQLLLAEQEAQRAQLTEIRAQAARYTDTAALHQALGTGTARIANARQGDG